MAENTVEDTIEEQNELTRNAEKKHSDIVKSMLEHRFEEVSGVLGAINTHMVEQTYFLNNISDIERENLEVNQDAALDESRAEQLENFSRDNTPNEEKHFSEKVLPKENKNKSDDGNEMSIAGIPLSKLITSAVLAVAASPYAVAALGGMIDGIFGFSVKDKILKLTDMVQDFYDKGIGGIVKDALKDLIPDFMKRSGSTEDLDFNIEPSTANVLGIGALTGGAALALDKANKAIRPKPDAANKNKLSFFGKTGSKLGMAGKLFGAAAGASGGLNLADYLSNRFGLDDVNRSRLEAGLGFGGAAAGTFFRVPLMAGSAIATTTGERIDSPEVMDGFQVAQSEASKLASTGDYEGAANLMKEFRTENNSTVVMPAMETPRYWKKESNWIEPPVSQPRENINSPTVSTSIQGLSSVPDSSYQIDNAYNSNTLNNSNVNTFKPQELPSRLMDAFNSVVPKLFDREQGTSETRRNERENNYSDTPSIIAPEIENGLDREEMNLPSGSGSRRNRRSDRRESSIPIELSMGNASFRRVNHLVNESEDSKGNTPVIIHDSFNNTVGPQDNSSKSFGGNGTTRGGDIRPRVANFSSASLFGSGSTQG